MKIEKTENNITLKVNWISNKLMVYMYLFYSIIPTILVVLFVPIFIRPIPFTTGIVVFMSLTFLYISIFALNKQILTILDVQQKTVRYAEKFLYSTKVFSYSFSDIKQIRLLKRLNSGRYKEQMLTLQFELSDGKMLSLGTEAVTSRNNLYDLGFDLSKLMLVPLFEFNSYTRVETKLYDANTGTDVISNKIKTTQKNRHIAIILAIIGVAILASILLGFAYVIYFKYPH